MIFVYRSALVTRFGAILNDPPTVQVNVIGTALNIVYICFFFAYTNNVKDKTLAWAQIGYGGAFVAAIFAYTYVENHNNLPFRFGLILTAVLFYFVGSPLLGLVRVIEKNHAFEFSKSLSYWKCSFVYHFHLQGEIIRKKSTEGLPFPIILTGTLISFLWFLYGVVSRENFVIFQNGVVFLMSIVQLALFAIYPSTPAKKTASPAKSGKTNDNKKKHE